MDEKDWLGGGFESNRTHLRWVAYRMLGWLSEADDAVQETWLRLSRSDTSEVENLGVHVPDPIVSREDGGDPEHQTLLADLVGLALLAVLDPDVVLRIDRGAVPPDASREVRGATAVAEQGFTFWGAGWFAQPALVNGAAGVVVARRGRPFSVTGFTVRRGKVIEIDIIADPTRLRQLDLAVVSY